MPVKSGYKMTEVGVIPEDWEVTRLSEIASIRTGPFGSSLHKSDYVVGGTPLINPTHIVDGKILPAAEVAVGAGTAKRLSEFSLLCNDIVIGRRGDIGRCAVVTETEAGWLCGTGSMIIRPTTQGTCSYIAIVVSGERAIKAISDSSVGSTMININQAGLGSLLLPCPPLLEQLAIAQTLSDVDALIESLSATLAKKRDIKQATMQQLLTGKTRLPGFSVSSNYKMTEVGLIPQDWEVRLLPEICRFRAGKAHEQVISDSGTYVCVNSKFISTDGVTRKYATTNFCIAKKDDILMVMSDLPNGKALAKTFLADHDDIYAVNQRVCALTTIEGAPGFLRFLFNRNTYFLKFDDGVSQTHLLNRVFLKFQFAAPRLVSEQQAISQTLTDLDTELRALEARVDKTRALKLGMMQALLTGRTRLI